MILNENMFYLYTSALDMLKNGG